MKFSYNTYYFIPTILSCDLYEDGKKGTEISVRWLSYSIFSYSYFTGHHETK